MKAIRQIGLATWICFACHTACAGVPDPQTLVENCFEHMRGKASESTVTMRVHRPDWERRMTIRAWTRGTADSLIRITAPPKDAGNGTLKKGRDMWMYNPKINRVIKLPPSMMSQAWMGSDFSNNDLAKSDSLIKDYGHTVTDERTIDGHRVYVIESIPKKGAPVIWGKQMLHIRDDFILLRQAFFDEAFEPVKVMTTRQIQLLGGKPYPKIWTMRPVDEDDTFTELHYESLVFKEAVPDRMFSVAQLKNRRRR